MEEQKALLICEEALAQPEDERLAWLQSRCGSDQILYQRVTELLDQVQNTDFSPLDDVFPQRDVETAPPERVGPYRVLELIGRGGMGSVYKGERADGAFERTVAIKFVGAIRSRSDAEQRFTQERQILARMRHENIAQLLDGGTVADRGYLVMEYIDGRPFDYDADRRTEHSLQAFCKVCAAIQYAHNKLILHRDIKPDNVLLDQDDTPKLLDFGIAKLNQNITDDSAADLTGQSPAPLTLNYSAPERLLGEPATVSTDVYSLGVYLHVLLNGSRPYNLTGKTLPEAWKELREYRDDKASGSEDDLQRIAAKAMHIDPLSRYSSAAELADDLQRFLKGQPVNARPPSWRYSLKRFAARHRLTVAAGLTSIALLLGAFALTAKAYLEADRQTEIAEVEALTASQAVEFLSTVLSSANPWVSDQKDLSVAEVLKFAKQRLDAGDMKNPVAQAYIEASLSMAHDGRGEFAEALSYANSAVSKLDTTSARSPAQRRALYAQGQALLHSDDAERAEKVLRRLLAELESAKESESWATVQAETLLANALENLALEDDALAIYNASLARADRLPEDDSAARTVLLNNIGRLLHQQGELDDAIYHYTQSLEINRSNDGSELSQAVLLANIAGIHGDRKDWGPAISMLRDALELHARANNSAGPNALISRTTLSNMQRQSGDLVGATETITGALSSASQALPEDHFITAYIQNVAAVVFCSTDDWPKGLEYARRSLTTRKKILPAGHWTVASGRSVLGRCETRAGNFAVARELLESALTQLTELRGAEGVATQQTQSRLAELDAAESR